MLKQLKILNPKLIITLGEFPTRNLLNFKFKKFSDVVGNIYEVDGYKILPIYHPSPISPKSYIDNVPIFEKLYSKLTNSFFISFLMIFHLLLYLHLFTLFLIL